MKRYLMLVLALLAGAGLSSTLLAQGARAQLDRFSAGLETFHAQFDQRVVSTDGVSADSSSGEVWLSRPRLFRWEYGGEFPELVVADGKNIWIYDKTLDQVTVKDQGLAVVDSPLTLLTDPGRLDTQFEVQEAGDTGNLELLELRPRNQESDFDRILLGLSGDALQLMIIEDAFGLRTELTFRDWQRNPPLESSLFRFEPPESADVIGEIQP